MLVYPIVYRLSATLDWWCRISNMAMEIPELAMEVFFAWENHPAKWMVFQQATFDCRMIYIYIHICIHIFTKYMYIYNYIYKVW